MPTWLRVVMSLPWDFADCRPRAVPPADEPCLVAWQANMLLWDCSA